MLIKCYNPEHVTKLTDTLMLDSKNDPTIVVNCEEVEERTLGTQVAQIDVVRKDGNICRFWIKIGVNNRGRVECSVACNDLNKTQSRRKSIFGSWFKPRVSAECQN